MAPLVRSWLEGQGLLVKPEFAAPWGICDFVALSFRSGRVRERLRLGQRRPVGSLLRVSLLHRIPDVKDGSVTVRCLEREFSDVIDTSRLASELRRLVQDRFVRFVRQGAVQKLNGWAPLHRRIVAVELKLGRIQEAFAQAKSHVGFADEVFVAFPEPLAIKVAAGTRAPIFDSAGVGVLAVGADGCTEVLRPRARGTIADPVLQAHCVERFWRTAL
jgi:hypothetical protein